MTTVAMWRAVLFAALLLFVEIAQAQGTGGSSPEPFLPPAADVVVEFGAHIAPILQQHCYACHGPQQQMSGLRLDQPGSALKGGYSGPAIQPGNSAESSLIQRVVGQGIPSDKIMPLGGRRLSAEEVGLLRAWIDQGAKRPQPDGSGTQGATPPPTRSDHWAFNAPRKPSVPQVQNQAWVRTPIDAFVLAKIEAAGFRPSPEADRRTLLRRVSLDLIGLPPTLREVEDFIQDRSEDAYERVVDRLLKSPHYGEKWARLWLDLAHYADSDGYEKDNVRPHAWRWRDWVIRALNQNMPFDQFTVEQLAGDLLPDSTIEQRIATGFLRNTLTNREGGVDREEYRVEQVMDRTETVGTTWLGLTVGCARCHDHKYDPITQKDFYGLFAFFNSTLERNVEDPLPRELGRFLQTRDEYNRQRQALLEEYNVLEPMAEWEQKTLWASEHVGQDPAFDVGWDLLGVMFDGGQEVLKKAPADRTEKEQNRLIDHFVEFAQASFGQKRHNELQLNVVHKKLRELARRYPRLSEAQVIVENPQRVRTHLMLRGDFRQPGIEVEPYTPASLNPMPSGAAPSRLALARWLVSSDNPLTARVTVNRMWQEFFGRGIVETSADFGTRSATPTHPQLLDWLATEFVRRGWDMKELHKMIVMSSVYRQSATTSDDMLEHDPDNKLLARQVRLRLPAELVRDAALTVSGLLDKTVGGPSIRPSQPESVLELGFQGGGKWEESEGGQRYRRGLYIQFLRTTPYPLMVTFDAPDSMRSCSRRERSTTPLQALNLLNDPVFFEAAQVLAARVLREDRGSTDSRLDHVFETVLGRLPKPDEKNRLRALYEEQKRILSANGGAGKVFPAAHLEGVDQVEAAVWVGVSRVLLNLEEFITRG